MPANNNKSTWTDYAKQMAAGQLGIATAYALSSRSPKKKSKPKSSKRPTKVKSTKAKPKKSAAYNAGRGMVASKNRYEQAARMSRGQ